MNRFLWGSAIAAYQAEGAWLADGKSKSCWDLYCHGPENYRNPKDTGDIAADFYHRYEEDIRLAAEGNQNAFRFSIAWTRIIPDGTGAVNPAGIAFYNRVIDTCLKYHVEPFVTLYHYDMPESLYQRGGWENRDMTDAFAEYAQVCFEAFGDRVRYWTTINEPNFDTLCGYGFGNYPPHKGGRLDLRWKAMYHMMLGSAKAVIHFRKGGYEGRIGVVSDSYSIESFGCAPADEEAIKNADIFYNRSVNDVCILGEYPERYYELLQRDGYDLSYMLAEDREVFKAGTVDFLGLNVYARLICEPYVRGETDLLVNNTGDESSENRTVVKDWFVLVQDPETEKTPWGVEINPKAMYMVLKMLDNAYPKLPIIVTENGIANFEEVENGAVHDQYRIDFTKGNIEWLLAAKEEGVSVEGYFVWAATDVYGWVNGFRKKYGLVHVDFENTLNRIPKDSYYWYRDFIAGMERK